MTRADTALGTTTRAVGISALFNNVDGAANTAVGSEALLFNDQTAHGFASGNTAVGQRALFNNIDASLNTAVGSAALANNDSTGHGSATNNTAVGAAALFDNTDGSENTAVGSAALSSITDNNGNTAVGYHALLHATGASNTVIGALALSNITTGNGNIVLGSAAGNVLQTGSGNIEIGNSGVTNNEHDTIRIGFLQTQTFIAGISGTAVTGTGVIVSATGQLGVATSSKRFKDEIKPMDKASEAILALKPVTFRYKQDIDPDGVPQFGLVAEDVEKVNPDLVVKDAEGKVYTVRYEAVNAMLLNEFLKEHRTVQQLEANAAKQQKQIEALTAGLQKVSAQLELSKSAPQTVLNDQ